MKLRIGLTDNDKYVLQMRRFFRWKTLPTLSLYVDSRIIAFMPGYRKFYDTFEEASDAAKDYRSHFCQPPAIVPVS